MNHPLPSALKAIAALSITIACIQTASGDISKFLSEHCIDCHDAATRKGGLDLFRLSKNATGHFDADLWERIHDRVESHEMPPKKAEQPSEIDRKSFTKSLAQTLAHKGEQRRTQFGRSPVRRMNRTEYETTVHDLFGITAPLKELLPEDNPVAGFDRVGRGLDTSALHLVRYQHAADRAIDAAVPLYPVERVTRRWTGEEFFNARPKPNQAGTAPFVRFDKESIVFAARTYKHGSITTPAVLTPGRYRIRASVAALHTEGKSIPVLIGKISSDRFQHEKLEHILDFRDALPEKRTLIELEANLPRGEQVYLEGVSLPFFQTFAKERNNAPIENSYPGPSLAVDWIEIDGPLDADLGYSRIFGKLPWLPSRYLADHQAGKPVRDDWKKWPVNGANSEYSNHPLTAYSSSPEDDARSLLADLLPRAFRRPVPSALLEEYMTLFKHAMRSGASFDTAIRETCKGVLCSPHFFLHIEAPGKLDPHALANRLSRLLWSSMPDDALRLAADSGTISTPASLRAQTDRMLNDPKSERFVDDFVGQWLELRRFYEMKPDDLYSEYDEPLAWSMPLETKKFIRTMLQQDRPATDLVASDWTFLNGRLAKHYGLLPLDRFELQKTALPPNSRRGGIITQAAILKITTNASYTSPVKRGAWILDRILGLTPPAPPADVAAVDPDIRGAVTLREQLDLHKKDASCATCHRSIDPPGFALENFDVIGGWRDFYRVRQPPQGGWRGDLPNYPNIKAWFAKPVEAWGQTPDGTPFDDIDGYRAALLRNPQQLTRNLVKQLVTYATGEPVSFADRPEVERIVQTASKQGGGLRTLLHEIIQSPLFREK